MDIISVVSAKGGVGKSTLTANLAVALRTRGYSVLAVDTDPQNSLHFHFSFRLKSDQGLVHAAHSDHSVQHLISPTPIGVDLLAYGHCTESQRADFEHVLNRSPDWLVRSLHNLQPRYDLILLDTPPGASSYLAQALSASTLVAGVTLADAGSYVTLPQLQSLVDTYCLPQRHFKGFGIIVNQVDQNKPLNRDVVSMVRASFGESVMGLIHLDQAVSEALAYGQDLFQYAPHSEAARDIAVCADWINRALSVVKVA